MTEKLALSFLLATIAALIVFGAIMWMVCLLVRDWWRRKHGKDALDIGNSFGTWFITVMIGLLLGWLAFGCQTAGL